MANVKMKYSTEEKEAWFRKWALDLAKGVRSNLPSTTQSRIAVAQHFKEMGGTGLGTTGIVKVLQELKMELAPTITQQLSSVETEGEKRAKLAKILLENGIRRLEIDEKGLILVITPF